jgi:hypothetical protein
MPHFTHPLLTIDVEYWLKSIGPLSPARPSAAMLSSTPHAAGHAQHA